MNMSYYGNMDILDLHEMDSDGEEENIYANTEPIIIPDVEAETENSVNKRHQTPQNTECYSVKPRSSRAVIVCLLLLCFLLLTAVIVLSVFVYTNNTNCTQERRQLLTNIANLTGDREQVITRNIYLTEVADHLQTKNTDLTKERDQEKNKNMQMTQERDRLSSNNNELTKQRDRLNQEKNELLKSLQNKDEWIYYKSSLYFISSDKKTWSESRRYCRDRGADLIVIKSKEEQSFVQKISSNEKVWIGLTDSEEESRWTWVDGSRQTNGSWDPREPNGGKEEDCALTYTTGWADFPCNEAYKWMCEKIILK